MSLETPFAAKHPATSVTVYYVLVSTELATRTKAIGSKGCKRARKGTKFKVVAVLAKPMVKDHRGNSDRFCRSDLPPLQPQNSALVDSGLHAIHSTLRKGTVSS